jgi:hypothetical protein
MLPSRQLPAGLVRSFQLPANEVADAVLSELSMMPDEHVRRAQAAVIARVAWNAVHPIDDLVGYRDDQAELVAAVLDAWPTVDGWTHPELQRLLYVIGRWQVLRVEVQAAANAIVRVLDGLSADQLADLEIEISWFLGAAEHPNGTEVPGLVAAVTRLMPSPMPMDEALVAIRRGDHWACRVRARLRRLDLPVQAVHDTLAIALIAGGDAKPARWNAKFDEVAVSTDLRPLFEVCIEEFLVIPLTLGWLPFYYWCKNEQIAAGLCAMLGRSAHLSSAAPASDPATLLADTKLLERAAFWGAAWDGNRPTSGPVARGAIRGLAEIGTDQALVTLHLLQERYGKRPGLAKPISAAIEDVLARQSRTLVEILATNGPTTGSDAEGVVVRRFEGYLRDLYPFSVAEHTAIMNGHPLVAGVARQFVWQFQIGDQWVSGAPSVEGSATSPTGEVDIRAATAIRLWHPVAVDAARSTVGETGPSKPGLNNRCHNYFVRFTLLSRTLLLTRRCEQTRSKRYCAHVDGV